jgi:hypothetical protein
MARPRKDLRSGSGGSAIAVELHAVPANTEEKRKRLDEAYELVAQFVALACATKRRKIAREEIKDAA